MNKVTKDKINASLKKSVEFVLKHPDNGEIFWAAFSNENALKPYLIDKQYCASENDNMFINWIDLKVNEYIASNLIKINFKDREKSYQDLFELGYEFAGLNAISEQIKLNNYSENVVYMVIAIVFFRNSSQVMYDYEHYYNALIFNKFCNDMYSRLIHKTIFSESDFRSLISKKNKGKANKRWSKHNEEKSKKKRQYLEIMKEKGFTQYTKTARYIKEHIDTEDTPTYETVKKWLSEADKGDFS